MEDELRKETFGLINQLCINVSQHALVDEHFFDKNSPELIKALEDLAAGLRRIPTPETRFDAQIANYVFYPISHVLNKDAVGDRIMELVMVCMEFLFRYGWRYTLAVDKARQLLAVILYFLSGPPQASTPTKEFLATSDETRLAGCRAMSSLYRAAVASSSNRNVGELSTLPMIAHSITVGVECVEYGKHKVDLQLAALEMLDVVLFEVIDDSNGLAVVVPGIISTVTKLIVGKFGVCNYKVAESGISLAGELLARVYNDTDLATSQDPDRKNRSEAWLKASKEQVRMSLAQIVAIRSHSRIEVQKSVLELCSKLVRSAKNSLDVCLPSLIDSLVFFLDTDLRIPASRILETILSDEQVQTVLQDRIYAWIESIPRLFTSHDDTLPVLVLNSIRDGMRLLQDRGVDCESMQQALSSTLSSSVVVEKPVHEQPNTGFKFDPTRMLEGKKQPKQIVGFDNLGVVSNLSTPTQSTLVLLLQSMGGTQFGPKLFQDFLIKTQQQQAKDELRLSNFWMAVNLLKGVTSAPSSDANNLVDDWLVGESSSLTAVEDVNDCVFDALAFSHDVIEQGAAAAAAAAASRTQTLQSTVAVALDAVSVVARYMGHEFQDELVDNIFPIVSYLGSPNGYVREQAQRTITQIATSCGYTNVRDLLVANADYLIDGISIKLSTLNITPQSATILSTLINMAGSAIAPYMDDLVDTMFVILDNYHGYTQLTEGIFKVLQTLVEETRKGYADQLMIDSGDVRDAVRNRIATYDELVAELDRKPDAPDLEPIGPEHHNNQPFSKRSSSSNGKEEGEKKIEEIDSDDGDDDEVSDEPEQKSESMDTAEEKEEKEWTSVVEKPAYLLVRRIVSYADTYLTHESSQLRFNILALLQDAMPLLSTSEKEFLPAVNEFWPVVASRLTEETEVHVLEQTLSTISAICKHSGSFMSQRVEKIWPVLLSLLPARITDPRPDFSNQRRRFKATVDCMAAILAHTPLPEHMFDSFVMYMAPVLAKPEFGDIKRALDAVNSDAVWLEMAYLAPTTMFPVPPPHCSLNLYTHTFA